MKVLVIGSGGMLGHVTTLYLSELGYEITDVSHTRKCRKETVLIDVLDKITFSDFLEQNQFDVVINCAAILPKASIENKAAAIMLNSYFPHFLEQFYKNQKVKVIQVSTGGVFSGTAAPYTESAPHDTCIFYGKTKSLGEIEGENNLTIRSDFVGPDMSKKGIGLFNWIMNSQGKVNGYSRAFFNGVFSIEFAQFVDFAIKNNVTGVYNLYSANSISKSDFLRLTCEKFGKKDVFICDNDNVVINTSLNTERIDIVYKQKSFEEQMDEVYEWVMSHKQLYPHYLEE